MSGGHQYETANVSGQATAILGNRYGDLINIQQATFLLQATSTAGTNNGPSKIVRHNQVLPDGETTVETVKTFNEGDHFRQRGAVEETELRWKRCEDLGVGSFGEVHREQTEQNGTTKSRAVKVLRRRHLVHMRVDHRKELDALIDLSQPDFVHRFVEFYSWYESGDSIYLAMEYIPCGDLETHIQAGLNESDARKIAYQVLDGIRIMHNLDLIHRDIKPANIFVVQREPLWWVKLGDFSICKRSMTRQTVLRTQVGTQGYQAPEVLGFVDTEKQNMYDSKCDIWSFGCLVFEMLTKKLPFPDTRTITHYCDDEIPFPGLLIKASGGSFLFAEFAWSLLQPNPWARPNAEQAMFLLSYRCNPRDVSKQIAHNRSHLYLKDCIGRHFEIPWQYCAGWIDMESTLRTLLCYVERNGIGLQVSLGHYDLRNSQGACLCANNWNESVSPGMFIFMSIKTRPKTSAKALASQMSLGDVANAQKLRSRPEADHCSPDQAESSKMSKILSEAQTHPESHQELALGDTRKAVLPTLGDAHHVVPLCHNEKNSKEESTIKSLHTAQPSSSKIARSEQSEDHVHESEDLAVGASSRLDPDSSGTENVIVPVINSGQSREKDRSPDKCTLSRKTVRLSHLDLTKYDETENIEDESPHNDNLHEDLLPSPSGVPSSSESSPDTKLSLTDLASKIILADWYGKIHVLSLAECGSWSRLVAIIADRFLGDRWHPMVQRGYFHLMLKPETKVRLLGRSWDQIVSVLGGKTLTMQIWLDAWIFHLPPQVTVEQLTKVGRQQAIERSHLWSKNWRWVDSRLSSSSSFLSRPIYFIDRDVDEYYVPWDKARRWATFIQFTTHHGHDCLKHCLSKSKSIEEQIVGYDFFVPMLQTLVDAQCWQWIHPGMSVYKIPHPMCSDERGRSAERTAEKMLRHLQS